MRITPELHAFLEHPKLKPHADRLLQTLGEVPVSRQAALIDLLKLQLQADERLQGLPEEFVADSVLALAEKWPSIVGPFAKDTGAALATALFCHEHPGELSTWLTKHGLDEQSLRPWITQWLQGKELLARLYHANTGNAGGGSR